MSAVSRGHNRERQLVTMLREQGWVCLRSPASNGTFDVLALKAGEKPRLIEVKSNEGSPFKHFGREDRAALLGEAEKAGAEAWLVHIQPRKGPVWLHSSSWPGVAPCSTMAA